MLSWLNSNLKFANNNLVAATCDGEDKAKSMGGLLLGANGSCAKPVSALKGRGQVYLAPRGRRPVSIRSVRHCAQSDNECRLRPTCVQ